MASTLIKKSVPMLLAFFLLGLTFPEKANGVLSVVINGIDTQSGTVRVAIYNSQDKFLEKKMATFIIKVHLWATTNLCV